MTIDMNRTDGPALFATMSTMRAMRRLKPEPVPDETLEQLIQAAVWGPSGGNMQCCLLYTSPSPRDS